MPTSEDKKQLRIWITHRYDFSTDISTAVSSRYVDASELEIKLPRPNDWLKGMEYVPYHVVLKPKSMDEPELILDVDFPRTLDAVENGYPVGLLAPQYEQTAARFLRQLDDNKLTEENDDGEIIIAKQPKKSTSIKPTALASQLIFDDNLQQIEDILNQLKAEVDERLNLGKKESIDIDVDGVKLQIKAEPTTEKVASELTTEEDFGGIIYADVESPDEAIIGIDKYSYEPFTKELLYVVFEKLSKINAIVTDGESISAALENYLSARKQIVEYRTRFDNNHGKGSLGLAIAAINYMRKYPDAILVGLDTQLAQEWLSGRDDNQLPDLVGIRLDDMAVDILEVKTYGNNDNSFQIKDEKISGHAVDQASILEGLMKEMFGSTERITTISRREILR